MWLLLLGVFEDLMERGAVHRPRPTRRVRWMSGDTLVSIEAAVKDLLGQVAAIGSLSAEDRVELDGLVREAAEARSVHESVMDTRAGVQNYVGVLQGLLGRAHQILGKYAA